MPDDFDSLALVVDWLDACRNENLESLLECFADDAALDCGCEGIHVSGRAALASYWSQRLGRLSPAAFGLEQIMPLAEGVAIECRNHEDRPIKIVFTFSAQGRIAYMRCEPASA